MNDKIGLLLSPARSVSNHKSGASMLNNDRFIVQRGVGVEVGIGVGY